MDARATIERDDAETWATWFRALGDPTRLLIDPASFTALVQAAKAAL